ncbi:hypothetical protein [Petrimonas sp.]|uniref:hypothetical protein n=1 Tax=Petrimonas sp. TaxID=2023866 RepID=UPI003F510231
MQEVLFHISQEMGEDIVSHHPISGGDISSAYLLVHLNLFGKGYYSGVLSILQRYF